MAYRIVGTWLGAAAFGFGCVVAASGAWAEDVPVYRLERQTIEALKRPQDPMAVDGMTGIAGPDDLLPNNFIRIDQIDRVLPDVVIRQRSASAYSNVTIRGLSSADFYNPTVQLLIDGIPQDFALFGILLPQGLRQVELLYGPQGTLYGASAVGGVLNIVTRMPDDRFRALVTGGAGNLDKDIHLLLNVPLIPGKLYGDVALNFLERDGEYKLPVTDENIGDSTHRSMRFRLRYAPKGSPLDIMIFGAHLSISSKEEQFVAEADLKDRTVLPVPSSYTLKVDSIGARAAYDFGSLTLTSLTGYQSRKFDRTIFGSYTPEDQTTFSQELRLATNTEARRRVDFVVGAFFQSLDFERRVPASFQTSKHRIYTYAGFGEATWHVTTRFDVTGGVRLHYEYAEAEGIGSVQFDSSDGFFGVSPKFAIGFQATKNIRLYGLFATGYKAGGFTRTIAASNLAFSYGPQTSYNGEIGLKATLFDRRLRLSVAGYYTYTKDFQLFVGLQPFQYLQNAGDVSTVGFNLKFTALPFGGLRLSGGVGVNDSRFVSYANPATPGVDLSGNKVPYAPTITANLQAEYTIRLPNGFGTLTPRAGMTYFGRMYFDETNTIGQTSYVLFNAGVTWQIGKHFKFDAYIDNIGDKTYTVYGFNGGPFLGNLYQLGSGRSFGVRMTLKL